MNPRELIAEAWRITIAHRRILLPWGALEAFVVMIAAVCFVTYQGFVLSIFFRTGNLSSWGSIADSVRPFAAEHPGLIIALIIAAAIYGILWLLVPRLATGAIIGLAAKIHCGDEPKGGLVLAIFNCMPLLELAAAFALIDGKTVFSLWSLLVRYMGATDVIFGTSIVLMLIWTVSFIFQFLFMFAEEAIVVRKMGVFHSIGHSFKLVISYLGRIVLIGILLLVIILRIILNAIVIFVIPATVLGLGFLLARFLPEFVSFTISGILGLAIAILASYFLGYVTVFKNTVWTITYLELSKERELDVIATEATAEEAKPESQEEASEQQDQNTEEINES